MKRVTLFIFVLFLIFSITLYASNGVTKKFSGTVTAIDPNGKGIVVSQKIGKSDFVVGAIVTASTVIKVKGENASLKDITVGDKVTLVYERLDDLYAKEIVKK